MSSPVEQRPSSVSPAPPSPSFHRDNPPTLPPPQGEGTLLHTHTHTDECDTSRNQLHVCSGVRQNLPGLSWWWRSCCAPSDWLLGWDLGDDSELTELKLGGGDIQKISLWICSIKPVLNTNKLFKVQQKQAETQTLAACLKLRTSRNRDEERLQYFMCSFF